MQLQRVLAHASKSVCSSPRSRLKLRRAFQVGVTENNRKHNSSKLPNDVDIGEVSDYKEELLTDFRKEYCTQFNTS